MDTDISSMPNYTLYQRMQQWLRIKTNLMYICIQISINKKGNNSSLLTNIRLQFDWHFSESNKVGRGTSPYYNNYSCKQTPTSNITLLLITELHRLLK